MTPILRSSLHRNVRFQVYYVLCYMEEKNHSPYIENLSKFCMNSLQLPFFSSNSEFHLDILLVHTAS